RASVRSWRSRAAIVRGLRRLAETALRHRSSLPRCAISGQRRSLQSLARSRGRRSSRRALVDEPRATLQGLGGAASPRATAELGGFETAACAPHVVGWCARARARLWLCAPVRRRRLGRPFAGERLDTLAA